MKITLQVLALTLCAGISHAQAPDDGHDHSAPGHVHREAVPAREETNVDYFWRKSDEAFHAGDYPRAIQLHRAVIALAPNDVESYSVASWLLWSSDQKAEALQLIARGLQANPENLSMWESAGAHYELQKMPKEAFDAYRRAVALVPADENKAEFQMLRRRLAHASEKANDGALSVQTWRDLVRDFPDDAVNKNNLARVEAKFK